MTDTSTNNKRIAKNTMLLYVRMLFLMLISLYTSRVVLNALGVEDYGIYNVVGGLVTMFSVLSGSFSSSVSRFLTFSLGEQNSEKLSRVFSTSVIIQSSVAIAILLIAEVVGIWFLNCRMNIPSERLFAANWVMHCSILTFAINLFSIPYNAAIIAHERMSAFAYVGIFEGSIKLLIAYLIAIATIDKLILYSVLLLILSLLIRVFYSFYCKRYFQECFFQFIIDRSLIKEMTGFAGWTVLGNGAYMLNTQGVNILINIYYGVALNAARGIASQVESAVLQFVNNFTTALNPQIIKTYAEGNLEYMHSLIYRGAKFSFYLMLFFAVPICIETEQILAIWLKIMPVYAVDFVRLTFISSMCTVIGNTLWTSQLATGQIKKYQIVVSIWGFWVFPLTWLAFEMGLSPIWAYVIYAFIYFVLIFVRIYLVKDLIKLSWINYINYVVLRCLLVSVLSFVVPFAFYKIHSPSIWRLIEVVVLSVLSVASTIYILGLDSNERNFVTRFIKKRFKHFNCNESNSL